MDESRCCLLYHILLVLGIYNAYKIYKMVYKMILVLFEGYFVVFWLYGYINLQYMCLHPNLEGNGVMELRCCHKRAEAQDRQCTPSSYVPAPLFFYLATVPLTVQTSFQDYSQILQAKLHV